MQVRSPLNTQSVLAMCSSPDRSKAKAASALKKKKKSMIGMCSAKVVLEKERFFFSWEGGLGEGGGGGAGGREEGELGVKFQNIDFFYLAVFKMQNSAMRRKSFTHDLTVITAHDHSTNCLKQLASLT